mgnify:CR=1 FL=1
MNKKSSMRVFRKGAALIVRERAYACRQWFLNIWQLWLVRAETWEAFREHDEQQAAMEPNVTLDAGEAFAHADYLDTLESARIYRLARRYGVHIPDHFFEWVCIPFDGRSRRRLTEEALAEVLPKIQEAARKRRQDIGYWVGLGIGVIGALTGLVSVFR